MSDDLIARLSADLRPVRANAIPRLLAAASVCGAIVAALVMVWRLGMRPDLPGALADPIFWTKFGYTAALAMLGAAAVRTLARPEGRIAWPWLAAIGLALILAVAALVQWMGATPEVASTLLIGTTMLVCPWYIIGLSSPILLGLMLVMRKFAPANPTLAGFAVGLMAGGAGAWVYSFHCGENGLAFLLIWYSLGILAVATLGAIIGRFALRW